MIVRFVWSDDIVTSEINSVSSRNFEERGLTFGNCDIQGLLIVLVKPSVL